MPSLPIRTERLGIGRRAVFEGANGGSPPIKCRDELRAAFRGTMLARMAGAEAEIEILGHCKGGDGNDRVLIEMMAESDNSDFSQELWDRYEPRMRRQTRRPVRKNRDKIERVSAALLERQTLQADEIDDLFHRPMRSR